jgi:hypothetical protein
MRTNRIARGAVAALALGVAAPAMAQDFCGGRSAGGQWIGGTEAASDVAASASYMEQMALVLMGNEYVALFSVGAPSEVRLEAQGRGAGDPVIDLYDEGGAIMLSDDDSGGNTASRAETTLQPGRYCLAVRSYDGSPMTGFVRVGRLEHEALTAGSDAPPPEPMPEPMPEPDPMPGGMAGGICDMATVTTFLGDGQALDPMLAAGVTETASPDEVPFWGFTLSAPAAISITAENPDADPVITLYDQSGGWLAENDDWDGLNSRIDMTAPLQPGSYCIAVNALRDKALPITVRVAAYDAMVAQSALYDRGEAAPPLDGSYPVTNLGPLSSRLRSDIQSTDRATWFSFDVPAAGLVLIEAVTNGQGDPTLRLFDDFGREVAYNDDDGQSLDSRLIARVLPGTYLVAVRQLGQGQQALTRMLFERYVPAQP